MSESTKSDSGVIFLIGLVLCGLAAYFSQNPVWGFSPYIFLIAALIVAFFIGFVGGSQEGEKAEKKLEILRRDKEDFERRYKDAEAELDDITLQMEDIDKEIEKAIEKGVAEAKSEKLKSALAERDELQNQVSSLASQLTKSAKEVEKLTSENQKKQSALRDEIEDINGQLVDAEEKADKKYQALSSKHTELTSTLDEERSRTKEFVANRIFEMSHDEVVDFINARLQIIRRAEMTGDTQSALIKLQSQIQSVFTENGLVDVNTLVEFDSNVFRINEYEAIIDLYMEKIKTVRQKSDIDEEDREEQIMSWRRLMDQEVAKMEGTA